MLVACCLLFVLLCCCVVVGCACPTLPNGKSGGSVLSSKSSNPATRGAAYLIPPFSSPNSLSATHSTQILRITQISAYITKLLVLKSTRI